MAEITKHKLEIDSHRVHYLKAGSGPPVVFVHGGASDSRDWIESMQALAPDYTLYAPDVIGFGQSGRDEKGYYLSDFSDFLLSFIGSLQIAKSVLVGHSFGARICLDAAIQNQESVSKLILIDASGLGKVSKFGTYFMTGFWYIRKLLGQQQPYPKFLVREGDDYDHVGADKLAGLNVPTLLVWKRHDPYLSVGYARDAVEIIPDAKLITVPGIGHAPHKQDNAFFNSLLRDFVDGK